jgi:hypothetical protein
MSETNVTVEAPEPAPTLEADQTAEIAAEVAAEVAEAITATSLPSASPDLPAINSSSASELSEQHLRLMRDNFELMYRKAEQQGELLQGAASTLLEVADEMRTTMELAQQMIARQDEQMERLGLAVAALAQVEARLSAHLTAAKAK